LEIHTENVEKPAPIISYSFIIGS